MTLLPPTTPAPTHGEDGSNGAAAPLAARVVLVGRTGLDAALRLDPSIELLRARNALDAVGELASPIDDTVPLDTTVIVSTDADPSPRHGGPAFINALRLVNPDVRVLLVGTGKRGDYDGVILSPLVPQDSLRAMVHRSTPARSTDRPPVPAGPPPSPPSSSSLVSPWPPAEPPPLTTAPSASVPTPTPSAHLRDGASSPAAPAAPAPKAEPPSPAPTIPALTPAVEARPPIAPPPPSIDPAVTPVPPRAPAVAAATAFADESALVEALLTGRDPLLPALDILRRRTGLPDLAYADSAIPFAPPTPVPTSRHHPAPAHAAAASAPESIPESTISPPSALSAASLSQATPGGRARITVPVVHNQRTFGYLATAGAVDPAALAPQARWLANWLALREQHDQLREAAFTDDLTGAYNRRYFDRFLAAALDRARADRLSVTVLLFDIDDFKQYNDRFGHVAGDEILKESVRLLKSVIRPTDRVCRIGGDEFAVIFFEPAGPRDPASRPPTSIWDIAQRFQRQVCEHRFPKLAEQAPGTLTISGGLATYPWDGTTPAELVERADALAIESKRKGKNVITLGPGAERVCGV